MFNNRQSVHQGRRRRNNGQIWLVNSRTLLVVEHYLRDTIKNVGTQLYTRNKLERYKVERYKVERYKQERYKLERYKLERLKLEKNKLEKLRLERH